MRKIKVTIERFDAERGAYQQDYCVTVDTREVVSAMTVLEYIYENLDQTLAFFSHAACKQAACGKCLVKMDGKVVLACKALILKDQVTLAPYNENVVRDLICR